MVKAILIQTIHGDFRDFTVVECNYIGIMSSGTVVEIHDCKYPDFQITSGGRNESARENFFWWDLTGNKVNGKIVIFRFSHSGNPIDIAKSHSDVKLWQQGNYAAVRDLVMDL